MSAGRAVARVPRGRWLRVTLLSWLAMVGFDLFLHGGLLARLYLEPSPFLLPAMEAFRRIPLGYLSFLLVAVLLTWLMDLLSVRGWRAGLVFGLKLGLLTWGSMAVALLSISTASASLLVAWWIGESAQIAVGGAVAGSGFGSKRLRGLAGRVALLVVVAVVLTVALQSLGLAPAMEKVGPGPGT